MKPGNVLETPISGDEDAPIRSDDGRDHEVHISDRSPPTVQLASETGGLLGRLLVQREHEESARQGETSVQERTPPPVARPEELRQCRGRYREILSLSLPLFRAFPGARVPPK